MKFVYILFAFLTLSGCMKLSETSTSVVPAKSSIAAESKSSMETYVPQDNLDFKAKNHDQLSVQDIEVAYEMCEKALTDYYHAIWNGSDIQLDTFFKNDYLRQYTQNKIQTLYEKYGKFNDKIKNIEISNWEAEYINDEKGGFLYLKLPSDIQKSIGGYGEVTEFLVRNTNGKLVIVDWYTGSKDSYDFLVRGENIKMDNPDIWNDDEWVKSLSVTTEDIIRLIR